MERFLFICSMIHAVFCQGFNPMLMCKVHSQENVLQDLKEDLFCGYQVDVRPVENHRYSTNISIYIVIQHYNVDEWTNAVDFHTYTSLIWNDDLLTWAPSKYGGIEKIQVMSNELWVPDIVSHSTTNADVDLEMPTTNCLVYSGKVVCVPQMVYTTTCEKHTMWWPYDVMTCSLEISSWSYSFKDISITTSKLEYDEESKQKIVNDTTWGLMDIDVNQYVVDSKFPFGFTASFITYTITLQRHSGIHSVNYFSIGFVLFAMTLSILWLEPISNGRMLLANLNFVLHLLALLHMSWTLPTNGNSIPKILSLFEDFFILAMFALILTITLRYMHRLTVDAPSWVSSALVFVLKNRIGHIFLLTVSDPEASAQMEESANDNTNLLSSDKKQSTWKYTSILIGWLSFVIVLFTYVILFAVKLPTRSSAYPVARNI